MLSFKKTTGGRGGGEGRQGLGEIHLHATPWLPALSPLAAHHRETPSHKINSYPAASPLTVTLSGEHHHDPLLTQ